MRAFKSFFDGEEGTADLFYRNTQDNIILFKDDGWHFSSILDDKGILKKMSGAADYNPDYKITDYSAFRTHSPNGNGYFGLVWQEDNVLPAEVWKKDIYKQFLVEKGDSHYHYLRRKNERTKPWTEEFSKQRPCGDYNLTAGN